MSEQLHFSVLGSLQITRARQPVRLGGARLRTLLATLLLRANQPVSLTEIGDRLWDHAPPTRARRVIQIYIVRLRQVLDGRDLIRTDSGGYWISLEQDQLDLLRFDMLLGTAATTSDLGRRAALLAEALTLSRGPACADIASDVLQSRDVAPILERRLDAEEQLIDAELALGRHAARVPQLRRLVSEYPLRERFTAQLMLALYRCGRRADALTTYRRTRDVLVKELGIEPGAELRRVHRQVLGADPALDAPGPVTRWVAPAQLPADSVAFTGRGHELDQILALPDHPRRTPTAVPHCAIDGMAGVGKTALAVHAAHRVAARFPDGQLFLDLHGFTSDVAPVHPADALDRMLRTLGIPDDAIPDGLDDRAALFRSTLAQRRMLVVLDNASSETQIRPLLPGAPGCLAIITSRRRLVGIDHTISLDVLSHSDAITLLARAAGVDSVSSGQSGALADIVRSCGHLPLAIRIAADRLRLHPAWTPADLAQRLHAQHRRLTELEAGRHSVTDAFELSYRDLAAEARRMFRLLGTHPEPIIEPHAAAALAGISPQHARRLLDTLHDAHLLSETSPGHYRMHDLLHAYATHTHEPERRTALARLLDHYTPAVPAPTGAVRHEGHPPLGWATPG